jgi:hypothetical protein
MIDFLAKMVMHVGTVVAELGWLQWLLVWGGAFLLLILWLCQRADDAFDLRNLVADPATGKIDRFAFGYVVGLVFFTWVLLFLTSEKMLTEWFALLYVVYAGAPKVIEPIVISRFGKPAA